MKLILKDHQGNLRVIPDSAIGRTSQPWFVPDFGSGWRARRALAVRVGRLGKCIAPAYFSRYIDAMTLLWVPESDAHPECADFMDSAVVCGKWCDPDKDADRLAELLSTVSRHATLKTGDIVAMTLEGEPEAIVPDTHVSADINGNEALSFNVK